MKNALISFVGINDKGINKQGGKSDGAILTVLKEMKFDYLHLLYTPSITDDYNFYGIANYIKERAVKKKYFKEEQISIHSIQCSNVTDHNEIYPILLDLCKSLPRGIEYVSAIASGTPAMQVCWILMAESGDFNLKLIRSNEPKYGKPLVTVVKLDTSLPKIQRLKRDNIKMIKEIKKNLPVVKLDTKKMKIEIDEQVLELSNIEFCYYYFFLKRAFDGFEPIKVVNNNPNEMFLNKINNLYSEFFPQSERKNSIATSFHSNISKINKKLRMMLGDNISSKFFTIQSEGMRGAKTYFIDLKKANIKII